MKTAFRQENLSHIRTIFERETGVTLPRRRAASRAFRAAVPLAAALLLSAAALADVRFSSISGDELSLGAAYRGGGVIEIAVENRSDKELCFEDKLKLVRWSTGEEVPLSGDVSFTGGRFAPGEGGVMTADLSRACDVAALERPVEDRYYLVLTNGGFLFGQDWHCSVSFAPPLSKGEEPPAVSGVRTSGLSGIEEALRPYFEQIELDAEKRRALNDAYARQVDELLSGFDGALVPSVSPLLLPAEPDEDVVFDPTFATEPQRVLTGYNGRSLDWDFKLLATPSESADVLSVMLPLKGYADAFRGLPLLYYFTYEKARVSPDAYAFVRGRLLTFAELEPYRVWEDGTYVRYELHALFWTDLDAYVEQWLLYNTDVRYDESLRARVRNVLAYYSAHTDFHEPR